MPKWLLLAMAQCALHAAVIRGVVMEHQTGRPLARVLVVASPVTGTPGASQSVRTNANGAFEFPPMVAGAYLVSASKRGFAPAQYGQKQYRAAGIPLVVENDATPFLNLRLQHFGAITGVIVDENEVGMPEHDVVAYRKTRPPKLAGKAITDDRGVYRIWGLEPGSYVVRTLAKKFDDGGYLPTFSREATRLDEAHPVDVLLDQSTESVTVRPLPGSLMTVAGQALTPMAGQVTLTLVSELGVETAMSDGSGNFQFNPQAPGAYELYASAEGTSKRGQGSVAGYRPLVVDRDRTDYRISLTAVPDVRFVLETPKGQQIDPRSAQVVIRARRKDLSGEGAMQSMPLGFNPVKMLPGRWELALAPSLNYYVAGFTGPKNDDAERGRPDGWNEIVISGANNYEQVKFVLSSSPAKIRGTVSNGRDPVAGAPVFLEAYDPAQQRRLTEVAIGRTDTRGQFQFAGLAPGKYRILSSFEFQSPEQSQMDAANARVLTVDEGGDLTADLELFLIR
jgi:hypothetical protein